MDKKYRINTDIGINKALNVSLKQDVDTLEILSLKMNQKDLYNLQEADYGIVIGRVLANESFGVPNVRLSIFIQVDADEIDEIKQFYPYVSTSTKDGDGIKYNLLPNLHNDDCKRAVGTLPSKEEMLDNDTYIEIYDKYLKYSTVTNNAGDYMIFGVPTGSHELHMSLDLSDIGILSQKPIDMMYQGHDINEFDSPTQFKSGTNLDDLSQIIQQNQSVTVYPLWGDKEESLAAITRCDIQVDYKFQPTCVFLGSIISDNKSNAINHKCQVKEKSGSNSQMTTGTGTIEMIRKTTNGLVESYQIQGNRLIDEDGVWCYQIPMNLDYVSTDETGNIVASKNPQKGIPTRTRVRFRISKDDTGDEGFSQHTAKYLVPNMPSWDEEVKLKVKDPESFKKHFNFGSNTLESDFRDLYWNNVYTVKNYIPRLQARKSQSVDEYSGLKNANVVEDQNPFPFNSARFKLPFLYVLLCIVIEIVVITIHVINLMIATLNMLLKGCIMDEINLNSGGGGWIIRAIKGFVLRLLKPIIKALICLPLNLLGKILELIPGIREILMMDCIAIKGIGDRPNTVFAPGCWSKAGKKEVDCPEDYPNCEVEDSSNELMDEVQRMLAIYYNIIRLDLTNDWVNGTLYMPLWYWKKRKKKTFLFGLFSLPARNQYCDCSKTKFKKNRLWRSCSFETDVNLVDQGNNDIEASNWHKRKHANSVLFKRGIVQSVKNKDDLDVYYYTPYVPEYSVDTLSSIENNSGAINSVMMYATDVVLIGNLNESNLYGVPQLFKFLPPTTSNPPDIATSSAEPDNEFQDESDGDNITPVAITGMDWGRKGDEKNPKYSTGLMMDLGCTSIETRAKTCVNLDRMSEFGVDLDMNLDVEFNNGSNIQTGEIVPDGMITKFELFDNEHRAMFATLNQITFDPTNDNAYVVDESTGYEIQKFKYLYPTNFDGHMSRSAASFTRSSTQKTEDVYDASYVKFRQGEKPHFYFTSAAKSSFPVYNNSYFFYFGLNPGKTAIEKFSGKYLAACERNEEYPFAIDVTSRPEASCQDDGINAYIILDMEDIETPYSYVISDFLGNEVFSDYDVTTKTLKIGYTIDEDGKFTEDNDGIAHSFNSDREYELQNVLYNVEVTDFNGNKSKVKVDLRQENLSVIYKTTPLSVAYYDGITKKEDICNEQQLYGQIDIGVVVVDGNQERITALLEKDEERGFVIVTTVGDTGKPHKIKITFQPQGEGETMADCGCYQSPHTPNTTFNDGLVSVTYDDVLNGLPSIRLNISKPMGYTATIQQICGEEVLLTNIGTQNINVDNGQDFIGFINDMPLNLILGTKGYNENFYPKSYNLSNSINSNDVAGWFKAHQTNAYDLDAYEINEENLDLWNTMAKSNSSYRIGDQKLYAQIAKAKIDGVRSVAGGIYESYNGTAYIYMSTQGGTPSILQRMANLNPTSIDTLKKPDVSNDANYEFTENSSYSNTANLSDIVTTNYVYIDDKGRKVNVNKTRYNPYFSKNDNCWVGQYYGAFTKNGGIATPKDGIIDTMVKFLSLPSKAYPVNGKPIGKDISIPYDTFQGSSWDILRRQGNVAGFGVTRPYFRTLTIDRRMDYDLFVIATSVYEDLELTEKKTDNYLWRTGRISGITYNGIELAYSGDDRTVISRDDDEKQLEYSYYKFDGINKGKIRWNSLNRPDDPLRMLYEANISDVIDIRDKFWSQEPNKKKVMSDYVAQHSNWDNTLFTKSDLVAGLSSLTNLSSLADFYQLKSVAGDIISSHLYYFDHKNDSNYNGAFDRTNYPTKRLIDIGAIPPSFQTMDINLWSNDYNKIQVDINDSVSEDTRLDGSMNEVAGGETYSVDLQSQLKVNDNIAKSNVLMMYFYDEKNKNNCYFAPVKLHLPVSLGDDANISNYNVFVKKPYLLKVMLNEKNSKDKVIINAMDHSTVTLSGLRKPKNRNMIDALINVSTFGKFDSIDGIDEIKYTSDENIQISDEILPVGDFDFENVVFTYYNERIYEQEPNVYAVFLREETQNVSEDNLTKRGEIYSFPLMADLRRTKFEFIKCEDMDEMAGEEDSVTDTGSTTGSSTGETTGDGSDTGGGSTTGGTGGIVGSGQMISKMYFVITIPDVEPNKTMEQHVIERKKWNHAFLKPDKISFSSEWYTKKKGEKEYKTTPIGQGHIISGSRKKELLLEHLGVDEEEFKKKYGDDFLNRALVFYINWTNDMGLLKDQEMGFKSKVNIWNVITKQPAWKIADIEGLKFYAKVIVKVDGGLKYEFYFQFDKDKKTIKPIPRYIE